MQKNWIPRVLIFAHNPISYMTGNGKTLATFFSQWPNSHLAQIYTSDLSLDINICANYYQINEIQLLKTIISKAYHGKIIDNIPIIQTKEALYGKSTIFRIFAKFFHSGLGLIIREHAWKRNFVNNNDLCGWVEQFHPDVIFFTMGEIANEYEFILNLSRQYKVPIVLYASDDYLGRDDYSILIKFHRAVLIKKYYKMALSAPLLIAISEPMAQKFKTVYSFNGRICIAMNCCDKISSFSRNDIILNGKSLLYTGNVGIGRWKVLMLLAKALDTLSSPEAYLSIYSSFSISSQEKKELSHVKRTKFMGSATHEMLCNLRDEADVLVFVESFDNKYKNLLSTALSTKIPEYLSSGKIIFGIGPSYSASIRYLEDNKVGYCVTELSIYAIQQTIMKIFDNSNETHQKIINNALQLAERNHNKQNVAKMVFQEICNLL